MPVKKKKSTSTAKSRKSGSRKASSSVEKDIKKAIEFIPNMIAQESRHTEKEIHEKDIPVIDTSKLPSYAHSSYKSRKVLLYFGVTFFAAIVFTMWSLNAAAFMGDANKRKNESKEAKMLQNVKSELTTIFADAGVKAKKINEEKTKLLIEIAKAKEEAQKLDLLVNNISQITNSTTNSNTTDITTTTEPLTAPEDITEN